MQKKGPKPPPAGITYGDFAYWTALIGMVIAIIGMIMYLSGAKSFSDCTTLMSHLWAGHDLHTIWEESAGEAVYGHWYLGKLPYADALAMLGIAICSVAAVFGTWGATFTMLRSKEKEYLYILFSLTCAVLLTLCALGVISLEH